MKTFNITLSATTPAAALTALEELVEAGQEGLDELDSVAIGIGQNAFAMNITRSGDYIPEDVEIATAVEEVAEIDPGFYMGDAGTVTLRDDAGFGDAALNGGFSFSKEEEPMVDGPSFKVIDLSDPSTYKDDPIAKAVMAFFGPALGQLPENRDDDQR